jgi:purine-binding chemotaxis protein CheW
MSGAPVARALVCRARARRCALPLEHVVEVMRPLPVQPVASSPDFVLGLAVIRGAPLPVVDLGSLWGGGRAAPAGRFVTMRAGHGRVALAVESVEGVIDLPEGLRGLPRLLGDAAGELVRALGVRDAELLLVLEAARLVPTELESEPGGGAA